MHVWFFPKKGTWSISSGGTRGHSLCFVRPVGINIPVCWIVTLMIMAENAHQLNAMSALPFHDLTNYNVENEFISVKRKIISLLNNEQFENLIKENHFDGLFNPRHWYPVSIMMKINSSQKIEMTVSIWIYFHSIYVVCQDMEGNLYVS